MAPIRIGLIGLSTSAKTSWASSAHLPYLNSPRGKERFEIVALLNSSISAAEKAIKEYNLDPNTKAYGSPEDLAADENVEFVVCCTRVDVHYDSVMPSVKAGKNVYVEWPLAENATRAGELASAAKKARGKTVVGLQGRVSPVTFKLKEVLASGVIGKVVSSEIAGFTPAGGGFSIGEGLGYFLDKKVGGNPVTIQFGHMIDYVHTVLGPFASYHAHTQIQRPNQEVINRETNSKRSVTSDVPDLVSVHGTLRSSSYVREDATLIATLRSGPPFPGTTPMIWTIIGEKGSLRITSERGPGIGSSANAFPIVVELTEFAKEGEVRRIEWEWEDWQTDLPAGGKDIAKLYDLYSEGRAEELGVADFESARARHEYIDSMLY